MFESFEDFIDSEMYEKYNLHPNWCFELIDNKIVSPTVGLEFYINSSFCCGLNNNILQKLFNFYNLDINGFYNLPTDSNELTTLLNSLCEYRKIDDIEMVLNLGANTNIKDKINYTPFQSLISGHSSDDIGKNSDIIKYGIKLLENFDTQFILEKWQFEEHYKPYMKIDDFFLDFLKKIKIVENETE